MATKDLAGEPVQLQWVEMTPEDIAYLRRL
jgi:hypothetical protein